MFFSHRACGDNVPYRRHWPLCLVLYIDNDSSRGGSSPSSHTDLVAKYLEAQAWIPKFDPNYMAR